MRVGTKSRTHFRPHVLGLRLPQGRHIGGPGPSSAWDQGRCARAEKADDHADNDDDHEGPGSKNVHVPTVRGASVPRTCVPQRLVQHVKEAVTIHFVHDPTVDVFTAGTAFIHDCLSTCSTIAGDDVDKML